MDSSIVILLLLVVVVAVVVTRKSTTPREGYAPVQSMAKKIPYVPFPNQRQRYQLKNDPINPDNPNDNCGFTQNASSVPKMTPDYCSYVCDTVEAHCRTDGAHAADPFYCAQSRQRCQMECQMNQHFMT